ncbi:pupal cuticle protein C1B-like [Battus philenor]|uniref:pupal cuticle protein C1B-like n=1 Tax=Battus philenor TaxID=42288 RepID=UPI0035D09D2E
MFLWLQVLAVLFVAGVASAGNLLNAAPLTYSAAPAVSHVSYTSHAAPVATYAAPAIASYSAPVIAKPFAAVTTYNSAPLSYAKSYSAPIYSSSYASPVISNYHSSPIVAKTITPALSYSSVAGHATPLTAYAAAPTYSSYAGSPIVKTGITYSAAPAVSHVSYSGIGASYGW